MLLLYNEFKGEFVINKWITTNCGLKENIYTIYSGVDKNEPLYIDKNSLSNSYLITLVIFHNILKIVVILT